MSRREMPRARAALVDSRLALIAVGNNRLGGRKETAMARWDVTRKGDDWVARDRSGTTHATGRTQAEAVRATAQAARQAGEPVSVRIHGRDGKIREERTYPGGADPRRSRG
jgi:hypothetical protein